MVISIFPRADAPASAFALPAQRLLAFDGATTHEIFGESGVAFRVVPDLIVTLPGDAADLPENIVGLIATTLKEGRIIALCAVEEGNIDWATGAVADRMSEPVGSGHA